MRWEKTIASGCRYGGIAERLFGNSEVLWEDSQDDYQGHAKVLCKNGENEYAFYEWNYGSCSGCDTWEANNTSPDEIEKEMRHCTAWMDRFSLEAYAGGLRKTNGNEHLAEAIEKELGIKAPSVETPRTPRWGP